MNKLIYPAIGLITVVAVVLLVGTAPGSTPSSPNKTDAMDIRGIEAKTDMKALPQQDLSPEIYK